MSCRHSLANNTCIDCYPLTGTLIPSGPGDGLDGPGARTKEELAAHIEEMRKKLVALGCTDLLGQDLIIEQMRQVTVFFRLNCNVNFSAALRKDGGTFNLPLSVSLSYSTPPGPTPVPLNFPLFSGEYLQHTWAGPVVPVDKSSLHLNSPTYSGFKVFNDDANQAVAHRCRKPTADRSTCMLDFGHEGDCKSRFCGKPINNSFCDRPPGHGTMCDADDLYEDEVKHVSLDDFKFATPEASVAEYEAYYEAYIDGLLALGWRKFVETTEGHLTNRRHQNRVTLKRRRLK